MASTTFNLSHLSTKSIPNPHSLLDLNKTRPIISFSKPFISNVHTVKLSCTDTLITARDEGALSLNPMVEVDKLKIAIVRFRNFGRFIDKGLRRQGHEVLATSRSDYSDYCKSNVIHFFRKMEEMCEEEPDIVLICCLILSIEMMVRAISIHKLTALLKLVSEYSVVALSPSRGNAVNELPIKTVLFALRKMSEHALCRHALQSSQVFPILAQLKCSANSTIAEYASYIITKATKS